MTAVRTLVAGFGNVLRGDDGFGVEVVHRLASRRLPEGVILLEVGTAGVRLAQELLTRYDRLVVVDALARGGAPGTLYVLRVDDVEPASEVDLHTAVPSEALAMARALGALPRDVTFVGCEPGQVDELLGSLSPSVRRAVEEAVRRIVTLVENGDPA